MRIYAAQVAFAQGQTETVEEIEDLDGDLAAVPNAVAEGGRGEPAVFRPGAGDWYVIVNSTGRTRASVSVRG